MEFIALALAILALFQAQTLRQRLTDAEARLAKLGAAGRGAPAPEAPRLAAAATVTGDRPSPAIWEHPRVEAAPAPAPEPVEFVERDRFRLPVPSFSFEDLFGRQLPIWGGALALALAGFFLVRYSIDAGLLTPAIRASLAGLFGLGLISGAELARRWSRISSDPRVAQALGGAGLAVLYATAYMVTSFYGLIPPLAGFGAMAAVTAAAIGLAFRHGAPAALVGLVGGFATPALVDSGGGSVPALMAYLALTTAGLIGLSRAQGWRWLAALALIGGFGWGGLALSLVENGIDGAATGMFLVALTCGALVASRPWLAETNHTLATALPAASAAIAFGQLAILVTRAGFGWLELGLYGLLSAALTVLAARDTVFRPLPIVGLLVALLALLLDWTPDAEQRLAVIAGVTAIFCIPAFILAARQRSMIWTAQSALAAVAVPALHAWTDGPGGEIIWTLAHAALTLAMFAGAEGAHRLPDADNGKRISLFAAAGALLGFATLTDALPAAIAPVAVLALGAAIARADRRWETIWVGLYPLAVVPLAIAAADLEALRAAAERAAGAPDIDLGAGFGFGLLPALATAATAVFARHDPIRAIFAGIAAGLAAFGLSQMLPVDMRAVSLGAFALLLAEASRRYPVPLAATGIASAACAAWGLMPLVKLLFAGALTLTGEPLLTGALPSASPTLLSLTLPGLLLALAARRVRGAGDTGPVLLFSLGAGAVIAGLFTAYKHVWAIATQPDFEAAGFAERTVLTTMLFGAALLLRHIRQGAPWARTAAIGLFSIAAFRFVAYDFLLFNPILATQSVGGWPLLNLLPVAYGGAALALWRASDDATLVRPDLRIAARILTLAALLALAGLLVRQAFQGAVLTGDSVTGAESLTYSLTGVSVAIGLLLWGSARDDRLVRTASLAVMLAAVAKVFLWDAAALSGLARIASFLGLGFSLIGIGWFYSRRVFRARSASN